ncbi:transglutaminase family protein [Candidatus Woesearchaeota archaeon]|nr:MAG: transglutaminase family protein [Candidatus Woesearchaeota archaeon]
MEEADKIHDEIVKEAIRDDEKPKGKGPIIYILSVFLILLMVLWIIPNYAIKLDPEPKNIPTIEEVIPPDLVINDSIHKLESNRDYRLYVTPNDPVVKRIASKIATQSCGSNRICQAKAMFYFVRDNFNYVGDPPDEYIETLLESLVSGGSDCDGHATALATLEEAIGVNAQLVFIPRHVFVRIKLDEAPKKYKLDDWIYLDATCKQCEFGEIPYQNKDKRKTFLEV